MRVWETARGETERQRKLAAPLHAGHAADQREKNGSLRCATSLNTARVDGRGARSQHTSVPKAFLGWRQVTIETPDGTTKTQEILPGAQIVLEVGEQVKKAGSFVPGRPPMSTRKCAACRARA